MAPSCFAHGARRLSTEVTMKLPTFAKKDEIPKGFESLYQETDGKWEPKPTETEKLEGTLETLRGEKKELEKKLKTATDAQTDLQRKLDVAAKGGEDFDKKSKELLDKWQKDTFKNPCHAAAAK
jgi:predicted nuclease with TOPRIM domain